MSTRACIARHKERYKFIGVYHHFDGYLDGLGKYLKLAYVKYFDRDSKAMMKYLIDDHPAGWSNIVGADLTREAGYLSRTTSRDCRTGCRPQCYCHGERHEGPNTLTERSGCGTEWAYAINERTDEMYIYERVYERTGTHESACFGMSADGTHWKLISIYDLNSTCTPKMIRQHPVLTRAILLGGLYLE